MTKIDNGGPAFPTRNYDPGMTLRDWFAGQALASMADDWDSYGDAAGTAYRIADNMLAARKNPPSVEI